MTSSYNKRIAQLQRKGSSKWRYGKSQYTMMLSLLDVGPTQKANMGTLRFAHALPPPVDVTLIPHTLRLTTYFLRPKEIGRAEDEHAMSRQTGSRWDTPSAQQQAPAPQPWATPATGIQPGQAAAYGAAPVLPYYQPDQVRSGADPARARSSSRRTHLDPPDLPLRPLTLSSKLPLQLPHGCNSSNSPRQRRQQPHGLSTRQQGRQHPPSSTNPPPNMSSSSSSHSRLHSNRSSHSTTSHLRPQLLSPSQRRRHNLGCAQLPGRETSWGSEHALMHGGGWGHAWGAREYAWWESMHARMGVMGE